MEFNSSCWREWHLKSPPSSVDPVCIVTFCVKGQTITRARRGEKMFLMICLLSSENVSGSSERLMSTSSSHVWSSHLQCLECNVTRLVNRPIASDSQGAAVAATRFRKPWRVFCPSHSREPLTCPSIIPVGFPASFLPVQTWLGCHYRSVHVRAQAWACTCLSLQRQLYYWWVCVCESALRMFCSLFPETGTFGEQELKMKSESVWTITEGGTRHMSDCYRYL